MNGKFSTNLTGNYKALATLKRQFRPGLWKSRRDCGGGIALRSAQRPPDRQKLLPPQARDSRAIEPAQLAERVTDRMACGRDRCGRIAMGAAAWLGHDGIDDAEPF
jgi:hypothetical protein